MFARSPGFVGGEEPPPPITGVVLLLHGDTSTDTSLYAHAATIGVDVSFDSSVPNGAIGTTSIRVAAGALDAGWYYGPVPEFKRQGVYTLEYWVYFDNDVAAAGFWAWIGKNDGLDARLFQAGEPNVLVNDAGWANTSGYAAATGVWIAIRVVSDGSTASFYADGALIENVSPSPPADSTDQELDITAPFGSPGDLRLMEIRWTQGVALNDPTDLTYTLQTGPWPDPV